MTFARTRWIAAVLLGAAAGCSSQSSSPYPSGGSQQLTSPAPSTSTILQVPAGARLVAGSATPPIPSFSIAEPGTIYIYDATVGKVVKVTSVTTPQNPIILGSMPDVGAVLDMSHQYNVYFVPMSQATTLPAAIGS